MSDPVRLRQVLMNLLSNACKFTEDGVVTLSCGPTDGGVRFVVEDTGTGIPPDQLDDIFEPFAQVVGGSRRAVQGTGLGLSLVRQLCHALGAKIEVESQLGVGSRFWVDVADSAPVVADAAPGPAPPNRPTGLSRVPRGGRAQERAPAGG